MPENGIHVTIIRKCGVAVDLFHIFIRCIRLTNDVVSLANNTVIIEIKITR